MQKRKRAQASIDLLVSYGIAILLISIALFVLLQLGIFNSRLAPTYCNAAPSFSCAAVAVSAKSGVMTLIFSQSTGATIYINGISCSTQQSVNSSGPKYGNINVLPYQAGPINTIGYYPGNQLQNGLVMYPSNQTRVFVNCYSNSHSPAKGQLGNSFTGFVWINYTISNLPANYYNVQQIASVSTKYT
jgi:uncharacterized protein (UPF0333 family)